MVQSYVLHWFQSTSPRWGRRIRITRLRMRFNPRPTRGATSANNARAYTNVFQSTPPREGRLTSIKRMLSNILFQSTPPHGGRPLLRPLNRSAIHVSIHAPTRGATSPPNMSECSHPCFNPRPHTRGDFFTSRSTLPSKWFQSTPPHEGRHFV